MRKKLEVYFYSLVHPYKVHDSLRNNIPIESYFGGELELISFTEAISISWVIKIIRGMLQLLIISFFTTALFSYTLPGSGWGEAFYESSKVNGYLIVTVTLILEVIFFPLAALFFAEFWMMLIKTYVWLMRPDEEGQDIAQEIVVVSMSSHVFEIIPFVGDFIQKISSFFLLYVGLRRNLKVSKSLSLLILATPFCMIFSIGLVLLLGISIFTS
jgi:hypothetical protein